MGANEIEAKIESLPKIEVMKKTGKYYAIDGNKLLYLYKKLQDAGGIAQINVKVVPFDEVTFSRRCTTSCDGQSVRVNDRGPPDTDEELNTMIETANKLRALFAE